MIENSHDITVHKVLLGMISAFFPCIFITHFPVDCMCLDSVIPQWAGVTPKGSTVLVLFHRLFDAYYKQLPN